MSLAIPAKIRVEFSILKSKALFSESALTGLGDFN